MMKINVLVVLTITLLGLSAMADTPPTPTPANYRDVNMELVAKIKVGSTTGAQVTELLGDPWRTTNYADCHPSDYQEMWEYVGRDDSGPFRVQIEFDDHGIARIVAKIPQKGSITVLAAAPRPTTHAH